MAENTPPSGMISRRDITENVSHHRTDVEREPSSTGEKYVSNCCVFVAGIGYSPRFRHCGGSKELISKDFK
jgi:hypothetical protein